VEEAHSLWADPGRGGFTREDDELTVCGEYQLMDTTVRSPFVAKLKV
jgi:hypothetical protein